MAVISYRYDDKTQLSSHFNVQEFHCKCGQNHDILIAEELISQLEKLYSTLNCSKIIVSFGHRCAAYDKRIGNGFGVNTKAEAKVEISEITGKPKEYDRDGVELIDAPEYAPI